MAICLSTKISIIAALVAILAESEASAAEEKPVHIFSTVQSVPLDTAESRLALRQYREAAALNRFTFPGNILEGAGDVVDHWIVMFCPSWHDKCQALLPSYELLGIQWENRLNKNVMSSGVRFAKVDCATDKALCVSNRIVDYPTVVHYRNGKHVASWHSGQSGLVSFLKQELENKKPRHSQSTRRTMPTPVCTEAGIFIPESSETDGHNSWSTMRSACLVLMLLAVLRSVWRLIALSFDGATGYTSSSSPRKRTAARRASADSQGTRHRTSSPQD